MSSFLIFILSPLLKYLTASVLIGAGGIALYLLTPAWFPARFRNTAGIIGIGALCVGGFFWYAFHAGEVHMAQRIAAKDQAAVQRVQQSTRNVEACINKGGEWDATVGSCSQ